MRYIAAGGPAFDDLKQLVRSPHLLAIALLIVMEQILGALMYNEQARYVRCEVFAPHRSQRSVFFPSVHCYSSRR